MEDCPLPERGQEPSPSGPDAEERVVVSSELPFAGSDRRPGRHERRRRRRTRSRPETGCLNRSFSLESLRCPLEVLETRASQETSLFHLPSGASTHDMVAPAVTCSGRAILPGYCPSSSQPLETTPALQEHSLRDSLPRLPGFVATVCLVLNVLVPGLGTLVCGLSACCCGQARPNKTTCAATNAGIALLQLLLTPLFLLGWLWSVHWGLLIVEEARRRGQQEHPPPLVVVQHTPVLLPSEPIFISTTSNLNPRNARHWHLLRRQVSQGRMPPVVLSPQQLEELVLKQGQRSNIHPALQNENRWASIRELGATSNAMQ